MISHPKLLSQATQALGVSSSESWVSSRFSYLRGRLPQAIRGVGEDGRTFPQCILPVAGPAVLSCWDCEGHCGLGIAQLEVP